MLTASQIIEKKQQSKTLTEVDIQFFVDGLSNGQFEDAQIGAFLMACYIQGLNRKEKSLLTKSMLFSGHTFKFKGKEYVDKHSTGGVGDKASFILGPIAAACGVKVPMIAGRGLGHTGGTIDKIESLPGFKTSLTLSEYAKQLKKIGIVLIGQTNEIAPADKKVYSIRDVTATISSIPLITASIMSKKLAEGANGFVFDVKYGNGAFMQELPNAKKLAKSLAQTGNDFKKPVITFVTDMNQVLGNKVGNANEVIESIETLRGNGPQDLTELSVKLAGAMIYLAGKAPSLEVGIQKALKSIKNGKAFEKFEQLVKAQGGDINYLHNTQLFATANEQSFIIAPKAGYIQSMNSKAIGMFLIELGGGRKKSGQTLDHQVGLECLVKVGDKVEKSQPLIKICHHQKQQALIDEFLIKDSLKLIKVGAQKVAKLKLIREIKEYL